MFVSVKSDFHLKDMVKLIDLHMWKMHSERLCIIKSVNECKGTWERGFSD